jgi:hypothetical protein
MIVRLRRRRLRYKKRGERREAAMLLEAVAVGVELDAT